MLLLVCFLVFLSSQWMSHISSASSLTAVTAGPSQFAVFQHSQTSFIVPRSMRTSTSQATPSLWTSEFQVYGVPFLHFNDSNVFSLFPPFVSMTIGCLLLPAVATSVITYISLFTLLVTYATTYEVTNSFSLVLSVNMVWFLHSYWTLTDRNSDPAIRKICLSSYLP